MRLKFILKSLDCLKQIFSKIYVITPDNLISKVEVFKFASLRYSLICVMMQGVSVINLSSTSIFLRLRNKPIELLNFVCSSTKVLRVISFFLLFIFRVKNSFKIYFPTCVVSTNSLYLLCLFLCFTSYYLVYRNRIELPFQNT